MRPHETRQITIRFLGNSENLTKTYKLKCFFRENESSSEEKSFYLKILTRSIAGALICTPSEIKLENLLLRSPVDVDFEIFNPSECDLDVKLYAIRANEGETEINSWNHEERLESKECIITRKELTVCSRCEDFIRVKICMEQEGSHTYFIGAALGESGNMSHIVQRLCTISSIAIFPCIHISDLLSEKYSKSLMWSAFSLFTLNKILSGPLETPSFQKNIEFDFGASVLGQKETVVNLNIQNTSVGDIEWFFNFPNDLGIQVDNWANPGEYTEEQSLHNFIVENNIFQISPKVLHF